MTLSATAKRYYPGAVQQPGPAHKVYTEANRVEGGILHSAEGYRAGLQSQLLTAEVSWHFTIYQDGKVEQHYPLDASCWHAGSKASNLRLIGVEHEGRAGEPLTESQVAASVALVDWLARTAVWPDRARGVRLYEHREVNPATVCPSGRIPWGRYVSTAPLPGGEFLPEPVEMRDLGQIATDLVYGVKNGRVELITHGPSPARAGWTRLVVDYLA